MNSIMVLLLLTRVFSLPFDALGKLFSARFAIPLLEGLVRDFALDEEFGEFAVLCLALEGHGGNISGIEDRGSGIGDSG